MRKNTKRFGAVIGVAACAVAMSVCRYTGFADAPSKSTASAATDWLLDQQESDGGFELANFTGFETSDAILAIGGERTTTGGMEHDSGPQRGACRGDERQRSVAQHRRPRR